MLSDKEATCLEVMAAGDFLALGDWEDIAKGLTAKGYARHLSGQYYRRTPAGQEALAAFEDGELRTMIRETRPPSAFDGVTIEGEVEDEG
jgi:hypothetical protein